MTKIIKKYLSIAALVFAYVVAAHFTASAASAQTMLNQCSGAVCSGANNGSCCGRNGSRHCTGSSCSRPINSDGTVGRVDKWHCDGNTADCRQVQVATTNSVAGNGGASLDISGFSCGTVQLDVYTNRFGDQLEDFIVVNVGPDCQGGPGPTNPPGPTDPPGGNVACGQACGSTSDCVQPAGKSVACVGGMCRNTACSGASVGAGCDCVDSFNRVCGQSCGNGSLCGTNSNGVASACTFVQGPACSQTAFVNGMYGICTPRLAAGDEYGDLFGANHLNGNWAVCSNDAGALYLSNGAQLANMTEAARIQRMCEWCGNGVMEASNNEQCDNGNLNGNAGNGCSDTCQLTAPTSTPVSCGGTCANNSQCAANHTCSSSGRCILATCGINGMFCGTDTNNQCGVICPTVTMSDPTPSVGEQVTFTCTAVPGTTSYNFRVHHVDGTMTPLTGANGGSSSTSVPFTITKPGHFDVQCQYCTGSSCSSFQTT